MSFLVPASMSDIGDNIGLQADKEKVVSGNNCQSPVKPAIAASLIIKCQGQEFRVLKSPICDKSPVFAGMCYGGFKVLKVSLCMVGAHS